MMKGFFSDSVKISAWEILSVIICVIFFTIWNAIATGTVYLTVPIFFTFLSVFCWVSGKLVTVFFSQTFKEIADFNLYFLLGFFFINLAVYGIQFILPFGLKIDLIIVCTAILIIFIIKTKISSIQIEKFSSSKDNFPSFLSFVLLLLATSFWAQSSINPIISAGETTIFKPWIDYFFHARCINAFASSHGFSTINSMLLSGQAAPFYHYASYIIPAELRSFTQTTAYYSYCSFHVPLGLLLSGLAAFVLIKSFWGPWAGFAACVALFLIPDPPQMGLNNHWLSYHWLQQIAATGLYGVALMSIAWIFMFDGCRNGRLSSVFMGFVLAFLSLNFKFHIFFANAFIIWMYPTLFFNKYSHTIKMIWFVFSISSYIIIVKLSQQITSIPLIRLDGSAAAKYTSFVISQFDSICLVEFFSAKISTIFPMLNDILWCCFMGFMMFINTFGIFGLLYFILLWLLRKTVDRNILMFPLIIIITYLVMSIGLAYDTHGVAMSEELLHRPFVWAYFIVTAWVGGAVYFYFHNKQIQINRMQIACIFIIILGLFLIPIKLGSDVQLGPKWGKEHINTAVPTGLAKSSEFIRKQSGKDDIIQDSQNDTKGIVTALSERQSYVMHYFTQRNLLPEQQSRMESLSNVKKMTNMADIKEYFTKENIRWYVLHPEDTVSWPKDLLQKYVFESHGYKVYSLQDSFN